MCPAAIVGVAIIQTQIGSEYTHTGINTLQSIDIILADCKQNRGEGGGGRPTQAQSASVLLWLFPLKVTERAALEATPLWEHLQTSVTF